MGAAHPSNADEPLTLERRVAAKERLVCEPDGWQEILHRYAATIVSGGSAKVRGARCIWRCWRGMG